jgi:VWFA-related protein
VNKKLAVRSFALGWVRGLAFLGCCGGLLAQQTPPVVGGDVAPLQRRNDSVTTLKAAVRLVLLDVVVTDGKGKPVTGLKKSDFTLLEDGVPQVVGSFEEHHPITHEEAAKAAAAVKLRPNQFTNYDPVPNESAATVFLLDALDTPVQGQMFLRQQMIEYMKTVPEGTKIAIFQLDTQMHMIQGFTSDPEVLRQAVDGKRNQPVQSPLLGGPMAPSYVRQKLRQDYLTQGIQALAKYLAPFPGRKNLIWFTGTVPFPVYGPGLNVPFPDVSSFIDDFSKTTDVLTLSRIAVYPIDARGLRTDPAFSAANSGRGGRGVGNFAVRDTFNHMDLDDIAQTTGGRAYYNTNGLKDKIAEIVDTGSNYYSMSYSPSNANWDGGYRKLQVKMAEQGLHLEYRRGYYARNNEAAERRHVAELRGNRRVLPVPAVGAAKSTTMEAAMAMGGFAPKDIIFLAGVTPSDEVQKVKGDEPLPKDNYLTKDYRKDAFREYKIHYSVNAGMMQFSPTPDLSFHARLEVVAVVYNDKGEQVNSKTSSSPIDVDKTSYAQILQHGLGTEQVIAIPVKGNYFLRVGVHDLNSDKVGVVEVPVDQIKLGVQPGPSPKP